MRKWIAVLIMTVLAVQIMSGLYTLLSFRLHQDEIARTLCINRFDSIPVCKGSCYLEKELRNDLEHEPIKQITYKMVILEWMIPPQSVPVIVTPSYIPEKSKHVVIQNCGKPYTQTASIFHPPRLTDHLS